MPQLVQNPFVPISSLQGQGLNNGDAYIGVVNEDPQTNPQAVYWDIGLTIPATQPLQVLGGYIMREGTPTQAFTANTYSIRALDRSGVQVFYNANATLALDLKMDADGSNADMTEGEKTAFRNYIEAEKFVAVYPEDFGTWTGTDDSAILALWVAHINAVGGYHALTPNRTYIATQVLTITGTGYVIEGNAGTIKMKSGVACDSSIYALMRMTGNNWHIRNLITDGNRSARTPAITAPTHNFNVIGCKDFVVENCSHINSVFDGSYVDTPDPATRSLYPARGVFINPSSDNSYRNAHSHICGDSITYENPSWTNSNGTAPQAGFDLEADSGHLTPASTNVTILGGVASGNLGAQWSFSNTHVPVGISAFGITADGTGAGVNAKAMIIAAKVAIRAADIRNFSGATSVSILDFDNNTVADFEGSISAITQRTGNCVESNVLSGSVDLTASNVSCAGLVTGSSSNGLHVKLSADTCGNNTGGSNMVTLGSNSSCEAYFKNCMGNMGISGSGNNDWDLEIDGYGLGEAGQNTLIIPAATDRINRLVARNPAMTTNVYGIGTADPGYIGYIDVDLPSGQVYNLTDPPVRNIAGAATLGKLTTSLYCSGSSYSVTLALTTTMPVDSSQQLIVVNNASGTVTFVAGSGDSLGGSGAVVTNTAAIFECNAGGRVWVRIK